MLLMLLPLRCVYFIDFVFLLLNVECWFWHFWHFWHFCSFCWSNILHIVINKHEKKFERISLYLALSRPSKLRQKDSRRKNSLIFQGVNIVSRSLIFLPYPNSPFIQYQYKMEYILSFVMFPTFLLQYLYIFIFIFLP